MFSKRHINLPGSSFLLKTAPDVMKTALPSFLTTGELALFSRSCIQLNTTYQPSFNQQALQQLLQAVIDDDGATAHRILDSNPKLLLVEPKDEKITEIESKYTFQRFRTEKALIMAQKLQRLHMTKLLLPYFEKLKKCYPHIQTELLSQWVIPPHNPKTELQKENRLEKYINNYLKPLADIITQDNCTEGVVSKKTEEQLEAFRKILLPEEPIELDKYVDTTQLLIGAYKVYNAHVSRFRNMDKRDIYVVRVIGLIQSVISPELAKAYCRGLYYVATLDERAKWLQMVTLPNFYHSSKNSRSGLGYNVVCSVWGCFHIGALSCQACSLSAISIKDTILGDVMIHPQMEKLYQKKAAAFDELTQKVLDKRKDSHPKIKSGCLIS